jgi:hypothetical protein
MVRVTESTDHRMGTNQDSKPFWATVLRRFQAFHTEAKLGYVEHPERSLGTTFQEISADCQKVLSTFRITKAAIVTGGIRVYELVAVLVGMYIKHADKPDYLFKTFDENEWVNVLAWKVLRNEPKWDGCSLSSGRESEHFSPIEHGNRTSSWQTRIIIDTAAKKR